MYTMLHRWFKTIWRYCGISLFWGPTTYYGTSVVLGPMDTMVLQWFKALMV